MKTLLNLVAAFTPESEALLPVFFVVFATVMAHIFMIYCKQFTVVFPNLPSPGTFPGNKVCLSPSPKQESFAMHKAYLRGLVSQKMVRRPPDLPDHFLRPAIGTWQANFYNMTIT